MRDDIRVRILNDMKNNRVDETEFVDSIIERLATEFPYMESAMDDMPDSLTAEYDKLEELYNDAVSDLDMRMDEMIRNLSIDSKKLVGKNTPDSLKDLVCEFLIKEESGKDLGQSIFGAWVGLLGITRKELASFDKEETVGMLENFYGSRLPEDIDYVLGRIMSCIDDIKDIGKDY